MSTKNITKNITENDTENLKLFLNFIKDNGLPLTITLNYNNDCSASFNHYWIEEHKCTSTFFGTGETPNDALLDLFVKCQDSTIMENNNRGGFCNFCLVPKLILN